MRYSVYLGKNAINETDTVKEQQFNVSNLIVHENYDYTVQSYNNDIGMFALYLIIPAIKRRVH